MPKNQPTAAKRAREAARQGVVRSVNLSKGQDVSRDGNGITASLRLAHSVSEPAVR